jgi:flagellar assembly protein FliH
MSAGVPHSPVVRGLVVEGDPVVPGPGPIRGGESATATATAAPAPGPAAREVASTRTREEGYEAGLREGRADGEQQGREAGYAAGHAAGLEAGRHDAARRAERAATEAAQQLRAQWATKLERMLAAVQTELSGVLARHEDELVAVAHEALGALVVESMATPDGVRARVRALLERAAQPPLRIRLHARDLAWLQDAPEWPSLRARHPVLAWDADASLAEGDVVVESRAETLEARLEVQLHRLTQEWLRAVQPAGAAPVVDARGAAR